MFFNPFGILGKRKKEEQAQQPVAPQYSSQAAPRDQYQSTPTNKTFGSFVVDSVGKVSKIDNYVKQYTTQGTPVVPFSGFQSMIANKPEDIDPDELVSHLDQNYHVDGLEDFKKAFQKIGQIPGVNNNTDMGVNKSVIDTTNQYNEENPQATSGNYNPAETLDENDYKQLSEGGKAFVRIMDKRVFLADQIRKQFSIGEDVSDEQILNDYISQKGDDVFKEDLALFESNPMNEMDDMLLQKGKQKDKTDLQTFATPIVRFLRGAADVGQGIYEGMDSVNVALGGEEHDRGRVFDEKMTGDLLGKRAGSEQFFQEVGRVAGSSAITAGVPIFQSLKGLKGAQYGLQLARNVIAGGAVGALDAVTYNMSTGEGTGSPLNIGTSAGIGASLPIVGIGLQAGKKLINSFLPKLQLSGLMNPSRLQYLKDKLIAEGVDGAEKMTSDDVANRFFNRNIKGSKNTMADNLLKNADASQNAVDDILAVDTKRYVNDTSNDLLERLSQEYDGSISPEGKLKFEKVNKLLELGKSQGLTLTEHNAVKRMIWDLDPFTSTGKVKLSKADLTAANSSLKRFIEETAAQSVDGVDLNTIKLLNNETQISRAAAEAITRKEASDMNREIISFLAGRSPGGIVGGVIGGTQGDTRQEKVRNVVIGTILGGALGNTALKTKTANILYKIFNKKEITVLQKYIKSGGKGNLKPNLQSKLMQFMDEVSMALPMKGPDAIPENGLPMTKSPITATPTAKPAGGVVEKYNYATDPNRAVNMTDRGALGLPEKATQGADITATPVGNVRKGQIVEGRVPNPKGNPPTGGETVSKANKGLPVKGESKLIEEAKKYKSADEFVKSQGRKVYHGTSKEFTEFDKGSFGTYGKGVYLTPDEVSAKGYAELRAGKGGKSNIINGVVTGKLKVFDDIPAYHRYAKQKDLYSSRRDTVSDIDKLNEEIIKDGFDGIEIIKAGDKGDLHEVVVFDPKKVKTESQLKDIRNKANSKPSVITKSKEAVGLKPKGGIVESMKTDILEEAKKYKTVEEFVDNSKIYHGTNQTFEDFDFSKSGKATGKMPSAKDNIFFTKDKNEAIAYAKASNKTQIVDEASFDKRTEETQAKIQKLQKQGKWDEATDLEVSFEEEYYKKVNALQDGKQVGPEIAVERFINFSKIKKVKIGGQATAGKLVDIFDQAKKEGYAGVELQGIIDAPVEFYPDNKGTTQYAIRDKSALVTESQLKKIREEAHKGIPLKKK